MTREERCKLAVERGFTYDPETGKIFNRYGKETKRIAGKGYVNVCIKVEGKTYNLYGHHFVWYWVHRECDIDQLDHINGIRTDNRICNLRKVTHQQNQHNRTKAKGYSWRKSANKWQAQIRINGKKKHLGYYTTEEEARQAYLNAKKLYHIM